MSATETREEKASSCSWCGPGECFCPDGPKTAEDCAPPCERCKGKGELAAINPHGYAVIACPACGGCGATP